VKDLFDYYNAELKFLREEGGDFAERYPKVASRLRITADAIEDPHVARLVESIALLNARIRLKLDDDFPELTEALLTVLYPHYLAPIPAMGILQLGMGPESTEPYKVPRHTELESEEVKGERCRFRTTQDLTLWPFEIVHASLKGKPFRAPRHEDVRTAQAALHVKLRCTTESATFSLLQPDRVRFHVAGSPAQALPLYELIANRRETTSEPHSKLIAVAIAEGVEDPKAVFLPPNAVQPVGFGRDEGMLAYPARSFIGYRVITEYFAFPEKFLFFDLVGLSARAMLGAGREIDLFFYFSDTDQELERSLDAKSLRLGCTPIINLFPRKAEPIALKGTAYEYRIVPDSRRKGTLEVYSVEQVEASTPDGTRHKFLPFFGMRHEPGAAYRFWQAMRRPAVGARDGGTEMFFTLCDRDANPTSAANWTAHIDILCLNRDLPRELRFGGGEPRLELLTPTPAIKRIELLAAFTPTRRPELGSGRLWRLLSHLNLNHLSIAGGEDGAEALREVLRLYDFADAPETKAAIDGITAVGSQRGLARVLAGDSTVIAHGIDVALTLDATRYAHPAGAYLFAAVLERFLGLYAAVNAFSRLTVRLDGRAGIMRRWPPRTGEKTLL
jgi:type VI secretion system protein ImpG